MECLFEIEIFPHPQPFPQGGKGVSPLSLWERGRGEGKGGAQ
jgi:hypothetical protein